MRSIGAALLMLTFVTPAAAQIGVKPAILKGDQGYVVAVRVTFDADGRHASSSERPWERGWNVSLDAPFAWTASKNPESIRFTGDIGWDKSLKKVQSDLTVDDHPDPIDWGFVRIQGGFETETEQTFDVGLFTGNAVLAYEHTERRIWFVPLLRVTAGAVRCIHCTTANEDKTFTKIDASGGWNVPLEHLGAKGALAPLYVRAYLRGFKAFGTPPDSTSKVEPDALGGSAELAYVAGSSFLREVFVRWASAAMPVRKEQSRAWAIGIALMGSK